MTRSLIIVGFILLSFSSEAQIADTLISYNQDSTLKYIQLKVDGKLIETRCYYANGAINFISLRRNGNSYMTNYYKNGNIESRKKLLGYSALPDSLIEGFYLNGNLKIKSMLAAGKMVGIYFTYYSNGQDSTVASFVNNKLNGVFKKYSDTGKLLIEGKYDSPMESMRYDTVLVNDAYEIISNINWEQGKEGVWKYYSDEGKLIKEEIWDKGKLVSTKEH